MTPIEIKNPDVLTGCDARVKVNGGIAGFLKNIQLSVSVNQQPVEAVGYFKPRGFKATRWSGECTAEFHILTVKQEGVVALPTDTPEEASRPYFIEIVQPSTGKRIANAIAIINTKDFTISTNELSGRRCGFVLQDLSELEGFN